jgi:hypothetical protein
MHALASMGRMRHMAYRPADAEPRGPMRVSQPERCQRRRNTTGNEGPCDGDEHGVSDEALVMETTMTGRQMRASPASWWRRLSAREAGNVPANAPKMSTPVTRLSLIMASAAQ